MKSERRDFLKTAGAATVLAATTGLNGAGLAAVPAPRTAARGLAKGLTLLTMRRQGRDRLAAKTASGILDIPQAAALLGLYVPASLDEMLQQEDGPSVEAVVAAALKSPKAKPAFAAEEALEYGPLVSRPEKIICVGLNYRKHAEETGAQVPKWPILFNKFNGALNRHKGTIRLPVEVAQKFDYEVELVIVMGRQAKNVAETDALSYVAGYATGNDFTARDLQQERGGQWMLGKAVDQFAPLGPYLVTGDQVDPDKLKIELRLNGQTRQSSNTADMVFSTRQIVAYASKFFTLKPGDIIFTGTPEGVITGMPKEKQVWLKPGDRIACSLEGLGELRFELV